MLGSNVPTIGGLPIGFQYADKWSCKCIQIYITLSRRWDVPDLFEGEISKFKSAWKNSSVEEVVAHLPYLANLASPDKILFEKAKVRLITELNRAEQLGVSLLVIHPGSHRGSGETAGIERIISSLNDAITIADNTTTKLLLETMAGQGSELGYSFEQLSRILEQVKNQNRFGICFDTCHVFAAGYEIDDYEGYERTVERFDKIIGIDRIQVFHLNDSKESLGSRIDRHASIGEGHLGLKCFHAIVKDPRFIDIPKILEIPERDEKSQQNLELLKRLQTFTREEVHNEHQARVQHRSKIRKLF